MRVRGFAFCCLAAAIATPATASEEALLAHLKAQTATETNPDDLTHIDNLLAPVVTIAATGPENEHGLELARQTNPFENQTSSAVFVQQLAPSFWRAFVSSGTLHCVDDWFFTEKNRGDVEPIATPPAFEMLCGSSYRDAGTAFGSPALVEISRLSIPYLGHDITITPFTDGWQPAYQVRLRLDDRFTISEAFCAEGEDCSVFEDIALSVVHHTVRPEDTVPAFEVRLKPAKTMFGEERVGYETAVSALPTFGGETQTSWPDFGPYELQALKDGLRTLLVQVGIGGVGWRALGDHLVVFSRDEGDRFTPFASFVIERNVVGVRSIEAAEPVPFEE
ncbi:MAG: hypothetical protein WA979_03215 [Pacificimonas sp.]